MGKKKQRQGENSRQQIYDYIVSYIEREAIGPTMREISQHVDLALSTVLSHLDTLELQGLIRRTPYKSRSLELVTSQERPPSKMVETVYEFIIGWFEERGYTPTQAEIAKGCYLSRAVVRRYLKQLEEDEFIELGHGHRQIKVVKKRTSSSK